MVLKTVTTDLFQMDYFIFGTGEKPLVILPGPSVQSVTLSADAVEKAYRSLADDFTVYVFDRRKELPPVYSMGDMARDAADAIIAAGIGRASVFGASQGAMIAMEIAARHPELVEKLILSSAAKRVTEAEQGIFDAWIDLAKAGDAEKLYLSFGEAIYPRAVFEESRVLLSEAAKTVTKEDLRRFVILANAARDFDGVRDLERIVCPTLVIGDTDDRIFGAGAAHAIAERLTNSPVADVFVYDGYGHALYDTAPDFKERIKKYFLQDKEI